MTLQIITYVKFNLSTTATLGTEERGDCREVAVVDKQEADLATERERHLTTGKSARKKLNSPSDVQFAAQPLAKPFV